MLRVEIKHTKPGMKLAMPVTNPQAPRRPLLSAGFELTGRTIERMRDLGVREVLVQYPGLEALDKYVNPEVLQQRAAMATELKETFEQIQHQAAARIAYESYLQHMAEMVEQLLSNPAAALFMDRAGGEDPWLLQHSSSVAHLALLMGLRLDAYLIRQRKKLPPRYAKQVASLGVGAMLHDIGILQLDPEVQRRYEQTLDSSDAEWRDHVRLGYELAREQVDPTAAVIILDHHQRCDGTGFPQRQSADGRRYTPTADKIHVFARITAAADAFAELRHPPGAEPIPTIRALARFAEEVPRRRFDPHVLRALFEVIPPFPPGVPVQLSDGRWGVPLDHTCDAPCQPRVQIVDDPETLLPPTDEDAEAEVIDLRQRADLSVVFAEGRDVSDDHFTMPDFRTVLAKAEETTAASA